MYIILRTSKWFDSEEDKAPDVRVDQYGFDQLEDAVEYIENELIPEEEKRADCYGMDEDGMNFEVVICGDRYNCDSYQATLKVRYSDRTLLRTIDYCIQVIQERG